MKNYYITYKVICLLIVFQLIWQNVSRHPAKHVNLKSNTIMKKPHDKYKKDFKTKQIFSIIKHKIIYFAKFLYNLHNWQAYTRQFVI